MKITFWGTRGSIASPGPETVIYGGNTTCVEVTLASGRTVVIDAGTGMRRLGDSLVARDGPLSIHLLMTHVHWDHLMGFPFFGPLYQSHALVTVDGCKRGPDSLRKIFSTNYVDGTWPITFDDLKAHIRPSHKLLRGHLSLDDTLIESHMLQHPQGGLGFKFTEQSGSFVFLTDNELLEEGWAGSSFKDFVRFCRDADLLVHDCQYLPEEMEVRRGWGHSDLASVARLALDAGVKRLFVFHHDPWRTDEGVARIVERITAMLHDSGSATVAEAAREGVTLIL
ncbi:MAG: MBL fold metallo-hydrolase [Desulfomonile tiedjei]|nr:MBL fold metallo-hydrolase [Desulfomonile tiedjei]